MEAASTLELIPTLLSALTRVVHVLRPLLSIESTLFTDALLLLWCGNHISVCVYFVLAVAVVAAHVRLDSSYAPLVNLVHQHTLERIVAQLCLSQWPPAIVVPLLSLLVDLPLTPSHVRTCVCVYV